jgi:hypothetical protein
VVEAAIARYGVPEHLRSDNGPEFIASCMHDKLRNQTGQAPALRGQVCLTCGPIFVTLRPWKHTPSASDPGQRPGGPKAISYQLLGAGVLSPKADGVGGIWRGMSDELG